jgi:hypothetical protein
MPADVDTETRAFIVAVCITRDLEQRLPLMNSIHEIEELRPATIALAHSEIKGLSNWGVRVGMMCQRRVQQLLHEKLPKTGTFIKKDRAPRPSGEVPPIPKVDSAEAHQEEEPSPPPAETKSSHTKKSGVSVERPKPKRPPATSDRFRSYWFKEKKLLESSFETVDLQRVGEYWWKYFNLWKQEEERILADSRQESARRKAAAALAKP